jgi:hypothetical protein
MVTYAYFTQKLIQTRDTMSSGGKPTRANQTLLPNWRERRRFDGSLMILDALTAVHAPSRPSGASA